MKNFESKKEKLTSLAHRLVEADVDQATLWSLAERGFLYTLFKKDTSDNCEYLVRFEEVISNVISKKVNSGNSENILLEGVWLCFDPTVTMYDELAETETLGFFDSCDVPPPEFWVGIYEQKLLSFIPKKFVDIAKLGVEATMGGSLYWCET